MAASQTHAESVCRRDLGERGSGTCPARLMVPFEGDIVIVHGSHVHERWRDVQSAVTEAPDRDARFARYVGADTGAGKIAGSCLIIGSGTALWASNADELLIQSPRQVSSCQLLCSVATSR